jgi:DNA-binding GntR family transcriptional regulator
MAGSTENGIDFAKAETISPESPSVPVGQSHGSLSEKIAAEIRAGIVTGRFRPGERLTEEDLAAQFDVSRNPVREALRQLSLAGFVNIVPRHGASVRVLDTKSVRELFEVRSALEALMARLAADRITPELIIELEGIVKKGRQAVRSHDFESLPSLNTAFHATIARAAANSRLLALNETVRDPIQWVYASAVRERASASWEEHAEMCAAICNRNPTVAAHLALHHINQAEAAYMENAVPGSVGV